MAEYYGTNKDVFTDPDTGEQYFVRVNAQTGEKQLWNEQIGPQDRHVGTISPDGTIDYNDDWWKFSGTNDDLSLIHI